MRLRLRLTYLSLLVGVLVGLDVPLAITLTTRASQAMFIDRLNDAERFASLAEPALRTGRLASLEAELRHYDELFGIAVAVVARDGRPVLATRSGMDLTAAPARDQLDAALSGQHAGLRNAVWPWQDEPLVVALPVGRDGEVTGAVLTASPTTVLRREVGWSLAGIAGGSLLMLAAGAVAAGPLARWVLRPVLRLDEAVAALADGRCDRVRTTSGPPEIRRLAASFNGMASRITTLLDRQRSFVSYASHQLRTPLATLRICAENLAPEVGPDGADDHQLLTEEIIRLGQLCDSLLRYARAEATAAAAVGDRVDAVRVVDTRVAAWLPLAERAGIRLERTGVDHAPVGAAARALDQALDALLSNAIKYVGAGGRVTITVCQDGAEWVEIHVTDNGPGMSPVELDRAAEAFWRGAGNADIDGSGLGLAIVQALVTASGGDLALSPAVPHGVHARIRLPATPAPVAADG